MVSERNKECSDCHGSGVLGQVDDSCDPHEHYNPCSSCGGSGTRRPGSD
jgi:DnaJ-class molecular chaperone